MAESVYDLMKASAASSIPHHRQKLDALETPVIQGMIGHLRTSLSAPALSALGFLDALEARRPEAFEQLAGLETAEIVKLHEGIQRCWGQISDGSQQHAIRHLYQLIAAHFFVYHVQS